MIWLLLIGGDEYPHQENGLFVFVTGALRKKAKKTIIKIEFERILFCQNSLKITKVDPKAKNIPISERPADMPVPHIIPSEQIEIGKNLKYFLLLMDKINVKIFKSKGKI
jgi:hypothetical protein